MIKIKRAYEKAEKEDGYRVLVDRLWPRGIAKKKLKHDEWARELSPSKELRQNFNHESSHWKEFRTKFKAQLRNKKAKEEIQLLAKKARRHTVTLVYGARDQEFNNAVVLKEVIERAQKKSSGKK